MHFSELPGAFFCAKLPGSEKQYCLLSVSYYNACLIVLIAVSGTFKWKLYHKTVTCLFSWSYLH